MGIMLPGAESMLASARALKESSMLWHSMAYLLVFVFALAALIQYHRASRNDSYSVNLPPGPVAVPLFGHWLKVGDRLTPRKMAELAQQYGDIMLLKMGRRNLVLVHSPELAKEFLHTQGVNFASRFSNLVIDIFSGAGKDLAFANYGEHWRKARRIVTVGLFTTHAIKRWTQIWEAEAERMVDALASKPEAFQGGVTIRESLELMVHNNLYMVLFGRRFESESDVLYVELRSLNAQRARLMQSFDYNYGDFHPIFYPLVRHYLRTCLKLKETRERILEFFISERKNRVTSTGPSQDDKIYGMDHILASVTAGEISDESALYVVENLNGAGTDTIVITLEWLIAELVNNPDVQNKLYAELKNAVGSEEQQTVIDCTNLPYLEAVIKETLRLHPAAPLVVPRMNLEPAKVAGYDIPTRSKVIVNSWWLANNPKWWKDPEVFNPERFLPGREEENVGVHGSSSKFLPFGLGRRQCPGMVMAITTVRLTVVKLVLEFELLPSPPSQKIDLKGRDGQFLMRMAVPPVILLRHRKPE